MDYRLASLKKLIDEDTSIGPYVLQDMTDEQLQRIVEACQPDPTEEEQSFYRLASARAERLQQENDELRNKIIAMAVNSPANRVVGPPPTFTP